MYRSRPKVWPRMITEINIIVLLTVIRIWVLSIKALAKYSNGSNHHQITFVCSKRSWDTDNVKDNIVKLACIDWVTIDADLLTDLTPCTVIVVYTWGREQASDCPHLCTSPDCLSQSEHMTLLPFSLPLHNWQKSSACNHPHFVTLPKISRSRPSHSLFSQKCLLRYNSNESRHPSQVPWTS